MTHDETPQFYDRAAGTLRRETVLGDKWLKFAYLSPLRGALRWPLFGCGLFSRLMGTYLDSGLSRRKIAPTIRQLDIDMADFVVPDGGFRSFNDFFARPLRAGARPLPSEPDALPSPAECRLTVYPELHGGQVIPVKGTPYSVEELLGEVGAGYAAGFDGGSLMVCRLCPADYHRYHCPANGTLLKYGCIRGKYHSVNPIALHLGLKVFTQNLRTVAIMRLERLGLCAYIAVGAFGVASIHDLLREGDAFRAGDTAGWFTFGGSTVIMAFPKGAVAFDDDILRHSADGVETLVRVNSKIGKCLP